MNHSTETNFYHEGRLLTAAPSAINTTTIVTEGTATNENTSSASRVIRLKLKAKKKESRVRWSSDVKDSRPNQKTSKKCCIYHKKRAFGESDSESDSSDDENDKEAGSDGSNDNGENEGRKEHEHHEHCQHEHGKD